jgi:hypothetical protein
MNNENQTQDMDNENQEQPVMVLIQAIKEGRTDPQTIGKELRQRCVEVFMGEGYTIANMAQILKKSEKTIKRDVQEIREINALTPDIELVSKIAGELLCYGHTHRNFLMRLARGKDGTVSEKAQAEYYAYLVSADLITKLQSLGYLPSAPRSVVGDIFHHMDKDGANDIAGLQNEIIEMERIVEAAGSNSDAVMKLDIVKKEIQAIEKNNTDKDAHPKEEDHGQSK